MKANDMAALRKALENSNGLLEELAAIGEWNESAREQIAENNAALAKPPRNCERFGNADEALEALEMHCNSSGNGCVRCPVAGCSTEEVECKIAWLFARAPEETILRISS